jgi:hypothetical protein
LQLRGLKAVQVALDRLELGGNFLSFSFELLRELHPFLLQLPELAAPLVVAGFRP